jgi:hypothetical protein
MAEFDFGADTAIVAVQHMLWQTVDLLAATAGLGVKRENIFALGKVYSNSPIVIGTLRDRGITVVDANTPAPGQFDRYAERDVHRLWEIVARNLAQRDVKRILVLDDGGQCITRVPVDVLQRYEMCGVEQTSFGMFLFERQPPPFAVMSWARTAVKLHIGGPLFSHCLLNKFESRILGGDVLTGANAGIIGLGSIGGALANLLMRQHNNVWFYDPDTELQVPQRLAGRITRVESLEDLMLRCEYVFGCSGRQPFTNNWPLKYRPGIKLFSGSGGDHEFGAIINYLRQQRTFRSNLDRLSRLSVQLCFARSRSGSDQRRAIGNGWLTCSVDSGAHVPVAVRYRSRRKQRYSSHLTRGANLRLSKMAHDDEGKANRFTASLWL